MPSTRSTNSKPSSRGRSSQAAPAKGPINKSPHGNMATPSNASQVRESIDKVLNTSLCPREFPSRVCSPGGAVLPTEIEAKRKVCLYFLLLYYLRYWISVTAKGSPVKSKKTTASVVETQKEGTFISIGCRCHTTYQMTVCSKQKKDLVDDGQGGGRRHKPTA